MITITKKNETYLHIDAEPSIMLELNDFFTFTVPGAQFTPQFRAKMWDGKIRLYNVYTKELYIGLLPYVAEFCKTNEYPYQNKCEFVYDDASKADEFIQSLQYHSNGKPIEIRDYQINAVKEAIKRNRVLLLSPTASGKSLIIYTLIRWHQSHNRKQLIIVPTTSLVELIIS